MEKSSINRVLIKYLLFVFIYILSNVFISSSVINYFLLGLLLLTVLFEKNKNMIYIIFFFHPLSGLFDLVGFKYTYNVLIFITALKFIIHKRFSIDKKVSICFFVIFLYDIVLELMYGKVDASLLSLISLGSSYMLVIAYLDDADTLDTELLYKFFLYGFLCSVLISSKDIILSLSSMKYRYAGLLRDPNAYAVDAILLIFYSICMKKRTNWQTWLIFLLGMLSVSKMYVVVAFIGFLAYFITNISRIKISSLIRSIGFLIVAIIVIIKVPAINYSVTKYYERFTSNTSLLSSRDTIQKIYINSIKQKPLNFFVGGGLLNYNKVFNNLEYGSISHFAHNTYFDLLFSWGIVGTALYLYFIYLFYRKLRITTHVSGKSSSYGVIAMVCFLLVIASLSYLPADTFILDVFLIMMLLYDKRKFAGNGSGVVNNVRR